MSRSSTSLLVTGLHGQATVLPWARWGCPTCGPTASGVHTISFSLRCRRYMVLQLVLIGSQGVVLPWTILWPLLMPLGTWGLERFHQLQGSVFLGQLVNSKYLSSLHTTLTPASTCLLQRRGTWPLLWIPTHRILQAFHQSLGHLAWIHLSLARRAHNAEWPMTSCPCTFCAFTQYVTLRYWARSVLSFLWYVTLSSGCLFSGVRNSPRYYLDLRTSKAQWSFRTAPLPMRTFTSLISSALR